MTSDVFRQVFCLLPEPTILVLSSGQVLACNRPMYEVLGYRKDASIEGLPLQSLLVDSEEKLFHFLRLCRRSRQLVPGALTWRTATGSEAQCRVEGALLSAATEASPGTILLRVFPKEAAPTQFRILNGRIQALHREIVERQRAQAGLHAEREWLRTTLASIGDAVIATDASSKVTFMNAVAEELTGWRQEDAAGQSLDVVFRIVHEQTLEEVESPVRAVLQRGAVVGLANHTMLIARDGVNRPIEDSGAPIRDEFGQIIGVVLVFRDVTEAHHIRTRIVQSERRFRRIFDTAPVAIWEQDLTGGLQSEMRIIDANSAALALFEAAGKAELLQGAHAMFTPETYSAFAEGLRAAAENKATFQSEAPLLSLRGKKLQVVFTMSFPDGDAGLSGVLVSFIDITARKRSEEALRRANAALVRANSDLEHFAYAAAHDLQEPLRNIVLHTQLLERRYLDSLNEEARESCQVSIEGAKRMQALVGGLLEYTRVVSESQVEADLDAESTLDCVHILESVKANLRAAIAESRAQIVCDELPLVHARDTHLVQLFQNLLSNAIKYKKPGEDPVIHIAARQEAGEWTFAVEDNGMGVAPEYRQRIFEAFRRLHGREIPGVGMGLTICNRIVAHYGGRIWVESEEGRGSRFAFTLPGRKRD